MTRRPPPGTTADFATTFDTRRAVGGATGRYGGNPQPETMTAEERTAVRRGLEDMQAGRLATEAEVEAAFGRFRR